MNVQFTGKIIAAEPVQQGTSQQGQPWASQNFVIEELNQQYPARAVFQVFGSDKLQQFNIQVGEIITANIGLKARQSQKDGRWFNQLDCWKVERFGAQQPQGQIVQSAMNQPMPQQGYQQPTAQPQGQPFPPQVNAAGQPINQQAQPAVGQPQGGNLPF
jgi:hypothetical protein